MKYQKELNPGGDLEVKLEQDGSDISYYYNFTISSHMLDAAKHPRLSIADCIREARQHIRRAIYDSRK